MKKSSKGPLGGSNPPYNGKWTMENGKRSKMTIELEVKDNFLPDFLELLSKYEEVKIKTENFKDYILLKDALKEKDKAVDIDELLK